MSHCWTCGNATAALQYECVQCKQLDVMSHIDQGVGQLGQSETLQSTIGAFQLQALNELKDKVEQGVLRVERGLSRVVSAIHWSTERLQWSLQR